VSELLFVVALVLLNGVFSGAEIALLSVRRTRVQELVDEGRLGARAVAGLRAQPESLLATVQVGITVIGATAAAFGGASLTDDAAAKLRPWLGDRADGVAFLVVVGGISYLSLVLGELVPKSLALRAAESYALLVAPALAAIAFVARPIVWVLTSSSNLVLRLFGDHTSFVESRLSSDELRQLVDEAATAGTVDEHAGDIAARALAFSDLDVGDVLIPRSEIVSVSRATTPSELAALNRKVGHSRVLVHGADPDDVLGYVNVRDALSTYVETGSCDLAACLHPVDFVPTSMRATMLLRAMQAKRQVVAVAVDEAGTVRGLVTVQDLVEELIGDLLSERERSRELLRPEGVGRWIADATAPLREVERVCGIELSSGDTSASTVGGLVLEHAQRIPEVGARFRIGAIGVEVLDATRRKVKTLALTVGPSEG
jgi:putative hemolysin